MNFRTTVIYYVSNTYKDNPYWYVDSSIIEKEMIDSADYQKVLNDLSKESVVRLDKKEHGKREFPPAWKALEYMSFGTIIKLYDSIKILICVVIYQMYME